METTTRTLTDSQLIFENLKTISSVANHLKELAYCFDRTGNEILSNELRDYGDILTAMSDETGKTLCLMAKADAEESERSCKELVGLAINHLITQIPNNSDKV
jgi:hypothetical protein